MNKADFNIVEIFKRDNGQISIRYLGEEKVAPFGYRKEKGSLNLALEFIAANGEYGYSHITDEKLWAVLMIKKEKL
jgi:hypothetical protein